MLGMKSGSGFQGHAYIILQVIRCCNIAVLLAIMVAYALAIGFAKMPNGYQFFNDAVYAFFFCVAGLLAYTEAPINKFQKEIVETWPIFGPNRGFTWLGFLMFLMGCQLLGSLSTNTYTSDSVPFQVWQVIMGASIIAIAFGVTNMAASVAFRNRQSATRAREIRSQGATTSDVNFKGDGHSMTSSTASIRAKISHPMPQDHDLERGHVEEYTHEDATGDRSSPIVPGLERPPTAMHPAYLGGHRSSYYSEASHLDRFDQNKIFAYRCISSSVQAQS
ncbi:hypothetical protein F4778DRAFT_720310 [Xylariomycetidae sp. FL2044]|nr:hypothetical protein F4778DRAFT_720310 [Xylariomycetidae sp. FL2044]